MLHAIHNPSSEIGSGREHVFGVLVFQKIGGLPSTQPKELALHQTRQAVSGIRKKTVISGTSI